MCFLMSLFLLNLSILVMEGFWYLICLLVFMRVMRFCVSFMSLWNCVFVVCCLVMLCIEMRMVLELW